MSSFVLLQVAAELCGCRYRSTAGGSPYDYLATSHLPRPATPQGPTVSTLTPQQIIESLGSRQAVASPASIASQILKPIPPKPAAPIQQPPKPAAFRVPDFNEVWKAQRTY